MLRVSLLLPAILSVAACSEGSGSTANGGSFEPTRVADAFFKAVKRSNEDTLVLVLTPAAMEGMRSGEGFQLQGDSLSSWKVGDAVVAGDVAEVPVVAVVRDQDQHMTLLMRQTKETGWRIHGLRVAMAEMGEFTIDFEELGGAVDTLSETVGGALEDAFTEAFTDLETGRSPEDVAVQRARFEGLEAIRRDEHEATWRYDLDAVGRSAFELVRDIVEPSGLEVDPHGVVAALDQVVELQAEGLSRVEALERVAAAVGLVPVYPDPNYAPGEPLAISFLRGQREYPAAFAGPFLVEVEELAEHVPHATGELTLAIRALGLAPQVLRFQDKMFEHVTVDRITSPGGASLHAEEGVQFLGTPQVRERYLTDRLSVELSGLLRPVERIRFVEGAIKLRLPAAVEEVSWREGDTDAHDLGFRTLELVEWGETTRFQYKAKPWQVESSEIRMSPLAADGSPLGTVHASSFGYDDVLNASLQCPSAPTRIDLRICTVEELEYPYLLERIPLTRHADMPEQLEELSFTGDEPVVASFVRWTKRDAEFPELALTLQNTSNKDVLSITAEFVYVGAAGGELGSFPHSLQGGYDFELSGPAPVVLRGMTVEQTSTAFFLPEGTAQIKMRTKDVKFVDGTSWEREAR